MAQTNSQQGSSPLRFTSDVDDLDHASLRNPLYNNNNEKEESKYDQSGGGNRYMVPPPATAAAALNMTWASETNGNAAPLGSLPFPAAMNSHASSSSSGFACTTQRSLLFGTAGNQWPLASPYTSSHQGPRPHEENREYFLPRTEASFLDNIFPFSTIPSGRWDTRNHALDRLQQALDMIPMMEKLDYLAALQITPELVLKESDPLRFLQFANMDVHLAAKKLACYWKRRRSIFGERAYAPMTITGSGALSEEDIQFIKSGYMAYAPRDRDDCTVVVYDYSRGTDDSVNVRLRATFYHAQCISENSASQTKGFVMLCLVTDSKYDHTTTECISMLIDSFPVKVKAWHSFDCVTDQNSLRQGFLFGFMEVFLNLMNTYTTYFYTSENQQDLRWELETEHGLTTEAIPRFLGGTWTYERFDEWLVERMAWEQECFSMTSEGRRMYFSPRPLKRPKQGSDGQPLLSDDSNSTKYDGGRKSDESGSVEELLSQFQQLMLSSEVGSIAGKKDANAKLIGKDKLELPTVGWPQNYLGPDMGNLQALQIALEAIPVRDKVDYLTALRVCPQLVLQESDPTRFLACYDNDVQESAQGLVRYWKQRRDIFGDRAFLPMSITGEGAMNAEDIEFVKCGNVAVSGTDRQGCSVILFDASRRSTDFPGVRYRGAFYVIQTITENWVNQRYGLVVINIISAANFDKVTTGIIKVLLSTFPMKMKSFHAIDCMKKIDLFRQGFIKGIIGVIFGICTASKIYFHRGEDTLQNLETKHGLTKDVLPCGIGGTWRYEQFDHWQTQRIRLELVRYGFSMNSNYLSSAMPASGITSTSRSGQLKDDTLLNNNAMAYMTGSDGQTMTSPPLSNASFASASPYHDANINFSNHQEFASNESENININQAESNNNPAPDNSLNDYDPQLLQKEIDLLPMEQTAAYRDAQKNAPPQVWENECNPTWFLRFEGYHYARAAERLARYWQLRRKLFAEKEYDPLTQTGEDALGRRELTLLVKGFIILLPNDNMGRSVLYVDPSRFKDGKPDEVRDRCIFYMLSLLLENEKTLDHGVILLHRLCAPRYTFLNAPLWEASSQAFPFRFSRTHLISLDGKVSVNNLTSQLQFGGQIHFHHGEFTKKQLCSELENFGMTKAGLPKLLNGDWGYDKFIQWQELRTRLEWKLPSGLSGRGCSELSTFPAMKSYTLLNDDEKDERKRRMNLIHFRRKQNRDRISVALLEENIAELREERQKLVQENEQLTTLHASTMNFINQCTSSSSGGQI